MLSQSAQHVTQHPSFTASAAALPFSPSIRGAIGRRAANPAITHRGRTPWLGGLLASLMALGLALPGLASAANIEVNTNADANPPANDGKCSLREAIINANDDAATWTDCAAGSGTDTITFSVAGTIPLVQPLPDVTDTDGLTIDGGDQITISGQNKRRVFFVNYGDLALENLTIIDGYPGSGNDGGGIFNNGGALTVRHCRLSGNKADEGGAIYNDHGKPFIVDSTLSENAADYGGAIYNDGDTIGLYRSTLSGNSAKIGGGIYNETSGKVQIVNSTLSGNSALGGGGIYSAGDLTVTSSTVAGNTAADGGGITNGGTATFTNSLVADNIETGGGQADCDNNGTLTANGSNLDTDATCPNFGHTTAAALNLGPLVNNGGPTRTHALLTGSVAIDTGDATECAANGIFYDQRDFARDDHCDIGAFEYEAGPQADLRVSKSANLTTVRTGQKLTYTIGVVNDGPYPARAVAVIDPIPLGTTFVSATPSFCSTPPVGSSGVVTCQLGDIPWGGSRTVTLVVKITARGRSTVTNTATGTSDTPDPNPADNTASVQTRVFGSGK